MAAVLPVVILHWNRPERCVGTVARFLDQDVPGGGRLPSRIVASRDDVRVTLLPKEWTFSQQSQ